MQFNGNGLELWNRQRPTSSSPINPLLLQLRPCIGNPAPVWPMPGLLPIPRRCPWFSSWRINFPLQPLTSNKPTHKPGLVKSRALIQGHLFANIMRPMVTKLSTVRSAADTSKATLNQLQKATRPRRKSLNPKNELVRTAGRNTTIRKTKWPVAGQCDERPRLGALFNCRPTHR